jgi:hypothetical protein
MSDSSTAENDPTGGRISPLPSGSQWTYTTHTGGFRKLTASRLSAGTGRSGAERPLRGPAKIQIRMVCA